MNKILYKQGWEACVNNEVRCPYDKRSYEAKCWWKGWFDCNNDPTRLSEMS